MGKTVPGWDQALQVDQLEELAARDSALFRAILDQSIAGVLIHRNHRPLYVNAAWATIHGLTLDDAMSLESTGELMHPEDQARVVGYYHARLRGEQVPATYDFRVTLPDGQVRTVQTRVVIMDWEGTPASCSTVIDVTAERARERLAHEGAAAAALDLRLIGAAVDQATDGLVVCDASQPGLPVVFSNPAFASITGYSKEEFVGKSCAVLHGPDTDPDTVDEIRAAIREGESFTGNILNYRRDGEPFWNRLTISPLRNADGDIEYFVGTQADITREIELSKGYRQTQTAMSQTVDRVGILDSEHRYVYANKALCEFLGYSLDELIGVSIESLVGEQIYNTRSREFLNAALRGETRTEIFTLKDANGKIGHNEYTVTPYRGEDGAISGVTLLSRDRSEEFEARSALALSESRFRDFASLGAELFWEVDSAGEFTWMSADMAHWAGSLDHAVGSTPDLHEMMAAGLDADALDGFEQAFARREVFEVEHHSNSRDGSRQIFQFSGTPVDGESGEQVAYRGIGRDVTIQRHMEAKLAWQASHDELTGLINRREFEHLARERLLDSAHQDVAHTLMFLDLDNLKVVNDTCGHAAGDRLLKHVADFLRAQADDQDLLLSRIGGDEFAILVAGLSVESAERFARELVDQGSQLHFVVSRKTFAISLSIGVVHLSSTDETIQNALASADVACYQAKALGRNRIAVYSEDDELLARQRRVNRMDAEIRRALDQDDFELYLQPIVAFDGDQTRLDKYEVLVRMIGADGELVQPGDFIDAAEAYGLITDVDRWVVRASVRLLARLDESIAFSINLSGRSLADPGLADDIERYLSDAGVAGGRVTFELTETAAITRYDAAIELMRRLKSMGCMISLDDFGSGLSSFRYLRDFDADEIKIDGGFIANLPRNRDDRILVASIVDIARGFDMSVTAEWVEDAATEQMIRDMGIQKGQGYHFGRPRSAAVVFPEIAQEKICCSQCIRDVASSEVWRKSRRESMPAAEPA